MTLIAFKPHPGALCRIVTAKRDGPDAQAPPGRWMVLDRHPSPGCWWLIAADSTSRQWGNENPVEYELMHRHVSRLMSVREPA